MIRSAEESDAQQIADIWNAIIRDTLVTFDPVEKTVAEVAARIAQKRSDGHAFLVAESNGAVIGYATYGQFRNGQGYKHSAEHSISLSPAAQGKGLGRAFMVALETHARNAGFHSIWAGVSGENPKGAAFHAAMGYEHIAVLPEVGFKFGQWIDLILMQKRL